jgi:hypothetical protein
MERRRYLAAITSTVSGFSLAGCSSDSDESGNTNSDDGGTSTRDGDGATPDSQLNVEGFFTASEQGNSSVLQAQVGAENPTDSSITATFAATISPAAGRDISSDSVEKTIPSGEQETFRLDIVDWSSMAWEQLTSIYFRSFQFQIAVNGTPVGEVCPDADLVEPNSTGCEYTYGVFETYVEVEYDGNWQGAFGAGTTQRTVSRSSAAFGAPEGFDTSYVNVNDDADIVSANAQKQDASSGELTIRIVHRDGVYAEQSTSAEYGVAQVAANVTTDSPIRERTGPDGSATPSASPEEFIDFLVNTIYDDPDNRFQNADQVSNQLYGVIHPDRRQNDLAPRELESLESIADDNVNIELVNSEIIDDNGDQVSMRVAYTKAGDRIERIYDLQLGPERDAWYVWDVKSSGNTSASETASQASILFDYFPEFGEEGDSRLYKERILIELQTPAELDSNNVEIQFEGGENCSSSDIRYGSEWRDGADPRDTVRYIDAGDFTRMGSTTTSCSLTGGTLQVLWRADGETVVIDEYQVP